MTDNVIANLFYRTKVITHAKNVFEYNGRELSELQLYLSEHDDCVEEIQEAAERLIGALSSFEARCDYDGILNKAALEARLAINRLAHNVLPDEANTEILNYIDEDIALMKDMCDVVQCVITEFGNLSYAVESYSVAVERFNNSRKVEAKDHVFLYAYSVLSEELKRLKLELIKFQVTVENVKVCLSNKQYAHKILCDKVLMIKSELDMATGSFISLEVYKRIQSRLVGVWVLVVAVLIKLFI